MTAVLDGDINRFIQEYLLMAAAKLIAQAGPEGVFPDTVGEYASFVYWPEARSVCRSHSLPESIAGFDVGRPGWL